MMSTPKLLELLRALSQAQVEYIVVGGVAAALEGAPIATFDLDIVHRREPENIGRLQAVLASLGAYYRGRPGARLQREVHHLSSPGHQLLLCDLGPIDVLGTIDAGRRYEDLLPASHVLRHEGLQIRVLDLEALIGIKERTGRPKDLAVLPVLRATLQRSKR